MTVKPNIMDFEASGFGAASYPIEVGFCLSNQDKFCALIRPDSRWQHWDQSAEAIHGISLQKLNAVGQPPLRVCQQLNHLLEGLTLYSDGWVADQQWLIVLYQAAGLSPSFHLSPIENIQTECQHLLWDKVRDRMLKESSFTRHRASSDAEFIQNVFVRSHQACSEQLDEAVSEKQQAISK